MTSSYHNFNDKELFEALIHYVEARYKPIVHRHANEDDHLVDYEDDWLIDVEKWKGETARHLETEFPTELHQFIQDLINEFLIKSDKQIWVLSNPLD